MFQTGSITTGMGWGMDPTTPLACGRLRVQVVCVGGRQTPNLLGGLVQCLPHSGSSYWSFWLVLVSIGLSQEEKAPDRWGLRKVPSRMPKAQVTIIPSSLWYAP